MPPSVDRSAVGAAAARRIGILDTGAPDERRLALWDLFRKRLAALGQIEGETFDLRFRWADGFAERLAGAAAELVAWPADVLVTAGTPAVEAAKRATREIPIVMATGTALGGPSSATNVSGLSDLPPGLSTKRLQWLRAALPDAPRLAVLADRGNPSSPPAVRETLEAAAAHGIGVKDYWLGGADELADAFDAMRTDGVGGFVVAPGAMFFTHRAALARCAIERGLAAMTVRREYAEAGALMAYGASIAENYRQAAALLDRILRGADPAALPLDAVCDFELVINAATARALGLTLSPTLLAQAQTIEA